MDRNTDIKTILLAGVTALAFLGFVVYGYMHSRATDENVSLWGEPTQIYSSEVYGFLLEVPASADIEEYQPGYIAIGERQGEGFASKADVEVVESMGEVHATFDAFLYARTQNMCAADGPGASISCTGLAESAAFRTATGETGTHFYLMEETRNMVSGEVSTASKGPFFAFRRTAGVAEGAYSALVVHVPIALLREEVDTFFIERVAYSVDFAE